jgi:hypothetical protein
MAVTVGAVILLQCTGLAMTYQVDEQVWYRDVLASYTDLTWDPITVTLQHGQWVQTTSFSNSSNYSDSEAAQMVGLSPDPFNWPKLVLWADEQTVEVAHGHTAEWVATYWRHEQVLVASLPGEYGSISASTPWGLTSYINFYY